MKIAEIIFVAVLLFIILVLVYGSVKSPPIRKDVKTTPKGIIKKTEQRKDIHVTFPPDLRKSEMSSLSHVEKNQQPTQELSDMYQEARDVIPTDKPFVECEGKLQNPPMRFHI